MQYAVLLLLAAFAAIGLVCGFNPDWGMRHFGRSLLRGGELRREWSRTQMSLVGFIFAIGAIYLLYAFFR